MKDYDKNKESSYLKYQDVNNICRQTMSQKLPLANFIWVEKTSEFSEDVIKSYNGEFNHNVIFLKLMSISSKFT